jgi:catechol 2,3-dioxygenase-like lactoylglutathione lyase family enzyme
MLTDSKAFSGFAVDDVPRARQFYTETLGLDADVADAMGGIMTLHLAGGRDVIVYPKPDHVPATYTILNFPVPDVGATVAALTAAGVRFERYEGMPQDDDGVMRGRGPDIAWFTDPAGNIMSVVQD